MSAPRILAQVVILGSQILGKAFVQAWRQAARNAQGSGRIGSESTSSSSSNSGDMISRTHRMTLDEATQILNIKKTGFKEETELQKMLKNFDHLFKMNNPTTAEGKPHSSHYLQSKIVRAKERIEAEIKANSGPGGSATAGGEGPTTTTGSRTGAETEGKA